MMHLNKTRAFVIHFSLSFLVFSILLFILYFFWFPEDYFMLDGGWQGIKLIAAIDLVLGPALTLLVFKPKKPRLVLDMSIIAAIQITALAYGFHAAYHQRTVGLVFAENEFTTISFKDLQLANDTIEKLGLEPAKIEDFGSGSPKQIFTESLTGETFREYLNDVLNGMPALRERTDKYKPLHEHTADLSQYRLEPEDITSPDTALKISEIALSEKRNPGNYEYYKFRARYGSGIAMFDTEKKRVTHLIKMDDNST